VSSPAPGGSIDGLRAFSRNPGRRASPASLLLSERLPTEGATGLERRVGSEIVALAALIAFFKRRGCF